MKRNNRNIVFFILAASLLLCFTSCKKNKETEMVTLKLALEQPIDPSNQKVYLDDQKLVCWYTDDEIKIHNGSSTSTSQVLNQTATVAQGTNYTAVYPAANSLGTANTVSNGSVTVTIPAVQTYVEGADGRQNLKDLPMGAYLTSNDAGNVPVLMFRNLASLIKVTVENPSSQHPFRVNSIKLTGSVPLHGEYMWNFSQSTNDYSPAMYTSSTSPTYGNEVLLDLNGCANPNDETDLSKYTFDTIGPDGSKTYYIVVAPFTTASTSFKVEMRGAVLGNYWEGSATGNYPGEAIKIYTKSFTGLNVTLDRSRIGTIPVHSTDYSVSGGFSTSSSSDIRYFSPGNLAQDYKELDYVFIHEQFATVGAYYNHVIYVLGHTHQADIDLFPYTAINSLSSNEVFTYWPNNLSYYEPAGTWKCPTYLQFDYILNGRTNISNRFAKIKIDLKRGLILFPDIFTIPNWVSFTNMNRHSTDFTDVITKVQWKLLEASGAIFLPTTGQMYQGDLTAHGGLFAGSWTSFGDNATQNQDNTIGFYWMRDNSPNWILIFQHMDVTVGGQYQSFVYVRQQTNTNFYQAMRPMRH